MVNAHPEAGKSLRCNQPPGRLRVHAYVDEMGDRGSSAKSSPFFAMAGVVIADEDRPELRQRINGIRARLKVPDQKALHWAEHVKIFRRRQFVVSELALLPRVLVNYVVFEKAAIPQKSHILGDQVAFYNYTAGILMERLLLTAQHWEGGARSLLVDFGHVRGFDHSHTQLYFETKKKRGQGPANWSLLEREPRFVHAGKNAGVQAADQYAGALRAALEPDEYGGFEHHHLLTLHGQIRRDRNGRSWGYGMKVLGTPDMTARLPWWPSGGI